MCHYQKFKSLLLLLFVVVTAKAQIENGKVYNFVNVGNNTKSMVISENNGVSIASTDMADYNQLWYVLQNSDNSYSLRNLGSGRYLRSSNVTSERWTMVAEIDANCKFNCVTAGSGYTLRATNTQGNYHYMHYGANQGMVVCWESGAVATQWTIQGVSNISDADLEANWNELRSVDPSETEIASYKAALKNLFSDEACTMLKKSFATETALTADADYQVLPAVLQQMVLKVYRNNWSEANLDNTKDTWDSDYAKKYRLQLYEPYNEPEAAASALGINAHTNLNNPTGIFTHGRQPLYVMVGGEIEEGASLYLASYTGNGKPGGYANGVELKQGLNVIPSITDGCNYVINYVVHTFDTSKGKGHKAKARKLSDYNPLKIHIEGGYINGYWNKMGDELYAPDTNADWDYIEARATQTTVTVLGEYITLQFPLHDAIDEGGYSNNGLSYYFKEVAVEDVIAEWDNIMIWERLLLGLLNEKVVKAEAKKSPYSDKDYVIEYTGNDSEFATGYGDYYNVHGLSFGVPSGYMYGSWDHCGYHYNTMDGVIRNLTTSAGSHWGPAHEIGHQHQSLLTVNGLTEVTNNLFSNVVLWYFGETTSRVNGDEGSLSHVLEAYNTEGSDFFTNNIWAQTHMYYKLFMYYHVLGHNPKFYPRLFEMLRQEPMSGGYNQSGVTSLLHFYKKCCLAAGEDLTEFFRAHGFLRVMTDRLVGDYANSVYNMTQEQIDAAVAEVKSWGYDENILVLFINDATGETIKSHKGGNLEKYGETTICAEVGNYASFKEGAAASDYSCTISGNSITMTGNGGVGFAVFNEKGEIMAFSDKKTFNVSIECAAAMALGKAEVKVLNADNSMVVVPFDDMVAKYEALGRLLDKVNGLLELGIEDSGNTHPGYYKIEYLADLQSAYDAALEVYEQKITKSYSAVCDALNKAYQAFDAKIIPIFANATYVLTNKATSTRSMVVTGNGYAVAGALTDMSAKAQQWVLEATDEEDVYKIKNVQTGTYLGALSSNTQIEATATAEEAVGYKAISIGDGSWALQCQTEENQQALNYNNPNNKVLGWGYEGDAGSHWYLTKVSAVNNDEVLYDLQNLIERTEVLMGEVGEVVEEYQKISLVAENYLTNAPCENAQNGDKFTSYSVLCDNNPSTYLHTDYSDQAPAEDHYIRIDLGSENRVVLFNLSYRTRMSGNVCAPTKVAIEASNDGSDWTILREVTSGLPITNDATYTFEGIGNGTAYRYIRMRVFENSSKQKANERYYFILSELSVSKVCFVEKMNNAFASMPEGILSSTHEIVLLAQNIMSAGDAKEYASVYADLEAKYNALLAAKDEVDEAVLNALKNQLSTLITETESLINSCGSVTYVSGVSEFLLGLQASNSSLPYYVSSNADQNTGGGANDGGGIAALVDNNENTYFHTRWSGDLVSEPHYIQVDMGEGITIRKFVFSYKPRNGSPAPTAMTIYGSNDSEAFTEVLAEINSGLPAHDSGNTYTSDIINSNGTAYRYLRFVVTRSDGPGKEIFNDQYFFGMLELDLIEKDKPGYYNVVLGAVADDVTEEMLLATYKFNEEALSVVKLATTKAQVEEAIAKLQAQYDALADANAAVRYQDYRVCVEGTRYISNAFGVEYQGEKYHDGDILNAPTTLTADQLKEINETASHQLERIVVADGVITVTYVPLYVVNVNGISDMGGVTFGGNFYGAGDEFPASSLDGLEAVVIDGYEVEMIVDEMFIYVSYYKNYAITIEGVSNNEPGTVCVQYNSTEYVDGNVIRTLGKIDENYLSLVAPHYYAVECFNVDHDASRIIVEFINKSYLNTLVGETTNMLADCDAYNYDFAEEVDNARTAKEAAEAVYNAYLVSASDYRNALNNLQSAKEALANVIQTESSNRQASREALNSLIGNASSLIADCAENPGDATDALIEEVNVVVTSAQAVANNMGSTVDELVAATEALQAKYDVLDAAQQSTAKATLRALIAQTQALIAECGTYGFGEHMVKTPVALQVDHVDAAYYLSTNADQNVVGNSKDGDGIAALIDGTVDTYMHTQWGGTAVEDDHYVQVSLGDGKGLAEFTFTYATRKGISAYYNSPAPTIIEVYGSSDGITFDAQIARFTSSDETNPLISYTELGEYWASENIKPNRAYGYLRFYVRESDGPSNDPTQHGAHYYFGMSEFALSAVSYETSYYVKSLTSYGNVTEEQFLNVARAYDAANDLVENSYDKDELAAATATLQSVYDVLVSAHNDYSYLPVILTTDVENPVLYVMGSQRGTGKVLQYDSAPDHKFSIVEPAEVNVNHLFYFTKGTKKGQVYVHPFTAEGQVLAASDKNVGADKVFVAEMDNEYAMQWTFEQETINEVVWYSLKGVGVSYFSHYGGGTNKMGFYDTKDEGSRFTLTTMKCHAAKIGQYLHTSLYLDYATTIPEGVKAYIAKNPSEEGTIDLVKLQGGVLPANTGVILYSETPGTYYFLQTDATATDNVNENLLKGCASEQYVGGDDTKKYYIFGRKNDEVGLYWARMDYTADGTYVGDDQGSHFKASANKVYLALDATTGASLSGFRFRTGTTDIEEVEGAEQEWVIYNLYGQRLNEIVTSGFYIVNGVKRYVHVK